MRAIESGRRGDVLLDKLGFALQFSGREVQCLRVQVVTANKHHASAAGRRVADRGGVLHQQHWISGAAVAQRGEIDFSFRALTRDLVVKQKVLATWQEFWPPRNTCRQSLDGLDGAAV